MPSPHTPLANGATRTCGPLPQRLKYRVAVDVFRMMTRAESPRADVPATAADNSTPSPGDRAVTDGSAVISVADYQCPPRRSAQTTTEKEFSNDSRAAHSQSGAQSR